MDLDELIERNLELEKDYEEKHEGTDKRLIYPRNWYGIQDLELKMRILEDAINNNILISQSQMYQTFNDFELNNRIHDNIKETIEKSTIK